MIRRRQAPSLTLIALAVSLSCFGALSQGCKKETQHKDGQRTKQGESSAAGADDELLELQQAAWAELEPAQTIEVTLTAQGPTFKERDFELTPTLLPTQHVSDPQWKIQEKETRVSLEGSARFKSAYIDARWDLDKGDPQASWSMKLNRVPLHQLSEPIELELTLPKGKITYIDEELRRRELGEKAVTLHAWTPGWLKWSNGQRALTLAEWSFDHVRLEPLKDGKVKLTFSVWDPRQHPSVAHCEVRGRDGLTLEHQMSVVFGERQDIVPARHAGGFEAAIVPIFVDPRWHPNKKLHEGIAQGTEDMLNRARTLLYGHSSSQEPRYGNGGLLGTNQGGTLLIEPELYDQPELKALAKELETTKAELGPYRAPKRQDSAMTFSGPSLSCEAYLERRDAASKQTLIELEAPQDGSYNNAIKPKVAMVIGDEERLSLPSAFVPELPATMSVPMLSGQRGALTEQAFSKLYVQRLIKERGVMWFATPLIGTRNPLVELAQDQLIEPDRYGHWTLDPELSSALGQLELHQEGESLTLLSAKSLNQYWRAARQVQLREQPDGALLLLNTQEPISQFTIITHGATITTVDGSTVAHSKDLTAQSGDPQRWFWFDLKKGAARVNFQESRDAQALKPTLWRVNKL